VSIRAAIFANTVEDKGRECGKDGPCFGRAAYSIRVSLGDRNAMKKDRRFVNAAHENDVVIRQGDVLLIYNGETVGEVECLAPW